MARIKAQVGSLQKAADEFIEVWKNAEQGKVTVDEKLYFSSPELLIKSLSVKRLELLRQLRAEGHTTIRALSKCLERDYKNVHNDVALLTDIGLIKRESDGQISMPWRSIMTEIPMDY